MTMSTLDGYFLIADITGYTRYLSESELEHAQETLTALLELLVKHTRPPLIISRLAGDAVISYGLAENFAGEAAFVEIIEDTYVTFRKAIDEMVLNNNCGCNACANISNLDLKFFVHFGTFGIQRISDHDELVGSDVNLLHRLLKNHVTETTGYRAYALYTDAAIRQLGIGDPDAVMTPHQETYEHLGETRVWVQDLEIVWEQKKDSLAIPFPTDRIWGQFIVDIDLPREVVWDYFVRPEFRMALQGADRMVPANRKTDQLAPGSVYQCYHGDKIVPQTVLESRPPERMLVRELSPVLHHVGVFSEFCFESTETGTRMTKTISRPFGPFAGLLMARLSAPKFLKFLNAALKQFKQHIEADFHANRPE